MEKKDIRNKVKETLNYYKGEIWQSGYNFVKWSLLAIVTGGIIGVFSSAFGHALSFATSLRNNISWLVFALPLAGVIIVWLYKKFGKDDGGTNQVFSTVRARDEVPVSAAPLIFVSTVLTHLTGGSAGREGAAIQLGGSIGNQLGRWLKLDEADMHVIVMCGMSAAFSALFGTPMAAAIFAMEVVSVGVMYYTALLPCVLSALIATNFAATMGIDPEAFHVTGIPELTMWNGLKMGVIALGCAGMSTIFCILLKSTGQVFRKYIKNSSFSSAFLMELMIFCSRMFCCWILSS